MTIAASALVLGSSFVLLLLLGVPIAFAIGAASILGLGVSMPWLPAATTLAQRVGTGLDSFALLAIPLFVFSGQLMNRGGAAARLVDLGRALVGRLPHGLVAVHVAACLLFGAISGSAVAAAAAIGAFLLPHLLSDGYERPFAAAVNVASSTTGLLVPPSNVLIVYSLASGGVSVAALFVAGYLPGLLLGLAVWLAATWTAPRTAVSLRSIEAPALGRAVWRALPSLLLIVIVMGGIVGGVFTATEAAGVSVVYSLLLTLAIYRELDLSQLRKVVLESAMTSGVVLLLVACSIGLSWVMAYENLPQAVAGALLALADQPWAVLLLIHVILLSVGTFMDMTPAILIFVPLFLPIVTELGVDPIHFGIVMVLNLCIGLCTPPVGTVLFVGSGVAQVGIGQVSRRLLPLYAAMVLTLLLVTFVPEISLWLPTRFGLR